MLGRLSPSLRARYASLIPARSPDRRGTITVSVLSMELSRDSARVTLSDEPLRPGDAVGVRIGLGAQGETLIERAYVTAVMPGSGGTVTELSFDELPRELWESVNECRQQGLPRSRPEHVVAGA